MSLLVIRNFNKHFGGLQALHNLDMEVEAGELRGIIGPNGAGKTTLFNLISGFMKPSSGQIIFSGKEITHYPPHRIAKNGLVRTFQASELFMNNTVAMNILVAFHLRTKINSFEAVLNLPSLKRKERDIFGKAMELIDLLGLTSVKDELAKNLPHGSQRALGIAIALAAGPKLLMLDEPATGMNPKESSDLMDMILKIKEHMDLTLIIVEHNMKIIMGLCNKITVLNFGRKIAEGCPREISENPLVQEAYLGSQ